MINLEKKWSEQGKNVLPLASAYSFHRLKGCLWVMGGRSHREVAWGYLEGRSGCFGLHFGQRKLRGGCGQRDRRREGAAEEECG